MSGRASALPDELLAVIQIIPAAGLRRKRVALMPGCGQQVLVPEVNEATVRLLTRHGIEVVIAAGSGCCGSSVLHVGEREKARADWNQHWFRRVMRARRRAVTRLQRRWQQLSRGNPIAEEDLRRRYHANLALYLYRVAA